MQALLCMLLCYDELNLLQENEKKKDRRKQMKEGGMARMLQNAKQNPIIHVENITPSRVMEGWILN
jgi:hypothetical protein